MTDRDDQSPTSLATRRAVLLGAGAIGVLAACGSDPPATTATQEPGTLPPLPTEPPAPTESPAPSAPSAPPAPESAIKTADIPVGGGKIYAEQSVVVTQPAQGTYKAFDAICQHQGCVVSSVANGKIVCECHNSQYNIADGSVLRGPATKGLPVKTVSVSGDSITVS
jgi:nitrite reductase/ring-hydroxylating ferredoxin subunit